MLITPPNDINEVKKYNMERLTKEEEVNIKSTIERILNIRRLPSYLIHDSLNSFLIGAMIEKYHSSSNIGDYISNSGYLRTRPLEPKDFQLKSWVIEIKEQPYEWFRDSRVDHTRVITGLITTIPCFDAIQIIENHRYYDVTRLYWVAHEIDYYTTYFIAILPYHIINAPRDSLGIRISSELDDFQMAVAEAAYQKGPPKKMMELFGITFASGEYDIGCWKMLR